MAGQRNFKSPEAYRKWLAYGHMRTAGGERAKKGESVFAKTPGHQKVSIKGKTHEVQHERKRKGLQKLAAQGK